MAGAFVLGACGKELGVKIYQSRVEMGGLYRAQAKELILFQDSHGFYCTDEAGMRKMVEALKTCRDLCDKD